MSDLDFKTNGLPTKCGCDPEITEENRAKPCNDGITMLHNEGTRLSAAAKDVQNQLDNAKNEKLNLELAKDTEIKNT